MSQAGQDEWVFGEAFNGMLGGYFVEVGAYNGVDFSNTYLLEQRFGWRGVVIEANPEIFKGMSRRRRAKCFNVCVDQAEGEVEFVSNGMLGGIAGLDAGSDTGSVRRLRTRPLADILREVGAPNEIDYLSVDIEGAEDRALLGFDFGAFRFKTITIERPSARLDALLRDEGYLAVRRIPGLDTFYLHESFAGTYRQNLEAFHARRRISFNLPRR